jgi:hypothetical protein
MEIQRHIIFHFIAFGMINLHYVIRICQKVYNRGRIIVNVWRLVRNSLHQTLCTVLKLIMHLCMTLESNYKSYIPVSRYLINFLRDFGLQRPNHASYRNFYFNEFVANALRDNKFTQDICNKDKKNSLYPKEVIF